METTHLTSNCFKKRQRNCFDSGVLHMCLNVVFWFIVCAGAFFYADMTMGQTVVTTYVTKVQEERYDTRFTLTEWLRIKERMRLMDLWLAMFSEPKTAKFRPELSLSYFKNQSALSYSPQNRLEGNASRAQIWLTNLISSQVGVRMLNVDFGGEFQREEHTFRGQLLGGAVSRALSASQTSGLENNVSPTTTTFGNQHSRLQSFMGNLRLFGKHIQDSSLIVKYGEFRYQGFDPTGINLLESVTHRGPLFGAELSLYISSWFGLAGQVQTLGEEPTGSRQGLLQGSVGEAQAFIEISVLRLVGGSFLRQWTLSDQQDKSQTSQSKQAGVFSGVQINL